jgi:aspartate-semialdehyde dehydrogenase
MKAASIVAKPYIVRNRMDTREQLHTLIDELPSSVINNIMDYILQIEKVAPYLQKQQGSTEEEMRLERNFEKIVTEDRNLLQRLAK